jgi:hypothetical protein
LATLSKFSCTLYIGGFVLWSEDKAPSIPQKKMQTFNGRIAFIVTERQREVGAIR